MAAPPPPPAPAPPAPPPPAPARRQQAAGAGAALSGAGARADPAWGYALTYSVAPDTFPATRAALQTITEAVTQEHAPRTGVVTYAFTCACAGGGGAADGDEDAPRRIGMLELFADSEAATSHLTENEGEAIVEMFQTSLQLVPGGATVINVDEEDKALQAGLVFSASATAGLQEASDAERREAQRAQGDQRTRFVWPAAGRVINPAALAGKFMERYPALRPPGDSGVVLELRAETETAEAGAAARAALCAVIPQHNEGLVSCFVCDAWWPDSSRYAVGLLLLAGRPDSVKGVCVCVCARVRACVHACMRACMHARVYVRVSWCVYLWLFICVGVCVCVCVRARAHARKSCDLRP